MIIKGFYAVFAISLLYSTVSQAGSVRGYYRSNGTYVAPHHRTDPNDTKLDNYSTKGNVNPYTGKEGTVDPYGNSSGKTRGSSKYRGYQQNSYGTEPSDKDVNSGEED